MFKAAVGAFIAICGVYNATQGHIWYAVGGVVMALCGAVFCLYAVATEEW